MNKNRERNSSFVGYEYKEVFVHPSMESIYADGYPNFGWELESILKRY